MKHQSDRNLLYYFLKSKHWESYKQEKTLNRQYQVDNDPERCYRLLHRSNNIPKIGAILDGVTIHDMVYDMYDAIYEAPIAEKTKERLYNEVTDLATYHEEMGTLEEVV